jgi:hypothetical protein
LGLGLDGWRNEGRRGAWDGSLIYRGGAKGCWDCLFLWAFPTDPSVRHAQRSGWPPLLWRLLFFHLGNMQPSYYTLSGPREREREKWESRGRRTTTTKVSSKQDERRGAKVETCTIICYTSWRIVFWERVGGWAGRKNPSREIE